MASVRFLAMATPTITFNNSTGSDTAASGAGPATALFGTAAALAASTLVTLSVDAPDLSGVATDGSACMWVDSSSGRQFSRITAVNNTTKVVTVATAYGVTESGKNWGIGGKRKTIDDADSVKLFADMQADWIISLDDDQSLTQVVPSSGAGSSTAGSIIIKSTSSRVTITQTGSNLSHFNVSGNFQRFENIKFANSHATKGKAAIYQNGGNVAIAAYNCIFGDATNTIKVGMLNDTYTSSNFTAVDCQFVSCTSHGIADSAGNPPNSQDAHKVIGCDIRSCTSNGILTNTGAWMVLDTVIASCGGDGINVGGNGLSSLVVKNCTIHGNTGDGIDLSTTNGISYMLVILNNNITGNGNYGVRGNSFIALQDLVLDFNNFGTGATANTSGARLNVTTGSSDIAVDPGYTNAAGFDFSVGTGVKALAFPAASRKVGGNPSTGSVSYVDVGAVQRQEAAAAISIQSPMFPIHVPEGVAAF